MLMLLKGTHRRYDGPPNHELDGLENAAKAGLKLEREVMR